MGVLCCHQMVIPSGLWLDTSKWQRFCGSAVYFQRTLYIFSLISNVCWQANYSSTYFHFQWSPPPVLSTFYKTDPCWIHVSQFGDLSKDPEGKYWWNLRLAQLQTCYWWWIFLLCLELPRNVGKVEFSEAFHKQPSILPKHRFEEHILWFSWTRSVWTSTLIIPATAKWTRIYGIFLTTLFQVS